MLSENQIELLTIINESKDPEKAVEVAYKIIMDYIAQHPEAIVKGEKV